MYENKAQKKNTKNPKRPEPVEISVGCSHLDFSMSYFQRQKNLVSENVNILGFSV